MTPAEMYRKLVTVRPEMAVSGLVKMRESEVFAWAFVHPNMAWVAIPEVAALALIADHWTERLPERHALVRFPDGWAILRRVAWQWEVHPIFMVKVYEQRVEALHQFHVSRKD